MYLKPVVIFKIKMDCFSRNLEAINIVERINNFFIIMHNYLHSTYLSPDFFSLPFSLSLNFLHEKFCNTKDETEAQEHEQFKVFLS